MLPLFTLACDNPVAPVACVDPLPVYAIREYPMKYEICFDSPSGEALTYTAKIPNTDVYFVSDYGLETYEPLQGLSLSFTLR